MKIRAIVHPAAKGGYWAEVPALPGCITEGETIEEVMINLWEKEKPTFTFIENNVNIETWIKSTDCKVLTLNGTQTKPKAT